MDAPGLTAKNKKRATFLPTHSTHVNLKMNPNPEAEVAKWMLAEFERDGQLFQVDAVLGIESKFGPEFLYDNENGNQAISKKVLKEFRKLSAGLVVWSRSEFCWLPKGEYDTGRVAY